MSLIIHILYLGTRYDVCECNSLQDMTISSFFVTFDLRLWPSSSVKVTFIFTIITKNEVCMFSRIWNMDICMEKLKWRHHDVITHLIFMKFNYKSAIDIFKGMLNFSLIRHNRAEMYSRLVNRYLWRKKWTLLIEFDRREIVWIELLAFYFSFSVFVP